MAFRIDGCELHSIKTRFFNIRSAEFVCTNTFHYLIFNFLYKHIPLFNFQKKSLRQLFPKLPFKSRSCQNYGAEAMISRNS